MQWAMVYQTLTSSRGIWGVIIVLAIIAVAIYAYSRSAASRRVGLGDMETGSPDTRTRANAEAQRAYRERTRDTQDTAGQNRPPENPGS